ncbi:hypothetical protein ACPPVO_00065 [Dactylosporangium sp. McL0621]|uniref:hypothetical protein n=1 Tax=Dactylosporangium sp. McL0621 TaxID=3415678 RepID=UPI003CE83ED8
MHAGLGMWSPTALKGRLRSTPTGCVLDYDIGWSMPVQLLGSTLIGAILLTAAGGAAAATYQLVTGHLNAAGTPAAVTGGAALAALIVYGLATTVRWASRDQVALLHSWLTEQTSRR